MRTRLKDLVASSTLIYISWQCTRKSYLCISRMNDSEELITEHLVHGHCGLCVILLHFSPIVWDIYIVKCVL